MTKQYDPDHYRVVFFSSAPIGVPFLQALAEDKRFEVVGVVTMPDAPSGRGMEMHENIIKVTSNELRGTSNDFVQTPTKLSMIAEWLKAKNPDFLVVIAYGKIIPQAILDLAKVAPINVHGSLLPKYRGASPLQSVFLNNETETGITIMKMDATMDTGDMIEKLRFTIPFDRTVKEVIEKMKEVGPGFLCDVLWKYGKNMLGGVKQKHDEATYCGKIEKESWLIDLGKDSLDSVYGKYRAFYLWPKVYFMVNKPTPDPSLVKEGNMRVIVEEIKLNEKLFEEHKSKPLIDNPCVERLMVKPEGKKVMEWKAFVNGYLK